MNELVPVLVLSIIGLAIYKIVELLVCRKERMTMIEKFSNGFDPSVLNQPINFPFAKDRNSGSWAIRIGLLLVGIGLGVVIATIVDLSTEGARVSDNAINALYPASAAMFGGIGLVIAYFIERKDTKNVEK